LDSTKNTQYIILNPVAGKRKGPKQWAKIKPVLEQAKIGFVLHTSAYALHEQQLFSDGIEEGYRNFILIGGDGTFHGVLNSFMEQPPEIRKEVTFTMIGAGTGNDWCRTFLNSAKPEQVIKWMIQGKTMVQDIGWASYQEKSKAEKRYFLNVAGMGFDAFVAKNYLSEHPSNSLVYLKGLLKGLMKFQAPKAHIQFDSEEVSDTVFILAAGNGRYFGGGMKITPRSDPQDGLLDFTLVRGVSKIKVISLLPSLYAGTFYDKSSQITHHRSKEVSVTSESPIFLQLDGEMVGQTPARFGIEPGAVRIVGEI
jgi:YegS/Rv2252/BmrU family lipid kinase